MLYMVLKYAVLGWHYLVSGLRSVGGPALNCQCVQMEFKNLQVEFKNCNKLPNTKTASFTTVISMCHSAFLDNLLLSGRLLCDKYEVCLPLVCSSLYLDLDNVISQHLLLLLTKLPAQSCFTIPSTGVLTIW